MVYYRRRRGGYRGRRPSYRRRFKRGPGYRRRSGYRRFRKGKMFPPKRGSFTGWPEINYVRHVWRDSYRVAPSTLNGNVINWAGAIRANSVWDPWYSVDTQNTPSRFAQMNDLYTRHTVLGSKITVVISGPTGWSEGTTVKTDQTEYVACFRQNDNDGVCSQKELDLFMAAPDRKNKWKRCQLSPLLAQGGLSSTAPVGGDCSHTSVKLTGNWSLKRDCGCTDPTNTVWGAQGNADPDMQRFYCFGLAYADSSGQSHSPGYLVEVRVEYFVKWENLKDLTFVQA